MKDMGGMMRQAQAMQAKLAEAQTQVAEGLYDGEAGGGAVTVVLQGTGLLHDVRLDDSLLVPGEADLVADLIKVAHNAAKAKIDAAQAAAMKEAMGPYAGLMGSMPGMPKLF